MYCPTGFVYENEFAEMYCAFCEEYDEDNAHLFFHCAKSRECWQAVNLWEDLTLLLQQFDSNVKMLMLHVLRLFSAEKSSLFAAIIWSIWKSRNNCIWEIQSESHQQIVMRANQFLQGWNEAHEQLHTSSSSPILRDVSWKKPGSSQLKCNIDASFAFNQNRMSIGMCIRDDSGSFVLARTEWHSPICSVDEGEALGLLSAMNWVHDLQLDGIVFELDSKRVVYSFHSTTEDVSEFGAIISECRHLSSLYFNNSSVEFTRRQANEVAHALARAATPLASVRLLIDTPSCIDHIITNEMN